MRSLNTRVAVSAALVLAVFIALSAYALERGFRDSARNARQERLLAQVYLLMAAAEVDTKGRLTLSGPPPEPRLELPGSGLYASIIDASGATVWRSRSALSGEPPIGTGALAAGVSDFHEVPGVQNRRYFVQRFGVSWATAGGSYPFTFSVAEDLAAFEQQIAVYRRTLWGWLGAMALLLLAGQWFTLRWGLAPLRRVADELKGLEQGRQQQIAGSYPTEVQALTDNLNALLAHERAQQTRYREALADLAHSLKTPLALVRAELRKALVERATARAIEEQVERMDRIVGYHLQRASTSGRAVLSAAQPMRPVLNRILDALGKVYADKKVEVETAVEAELRFRGDEGDLTELLGNVLDNAFKWCQRRVRVIASQEEHRLRVIVEDDGDGISDADAERVLQRGVRADESVPGHGIGLAVTRDIVAAYDGRIEIGRGALGGAAVTLLLPAAG